MSQIKLTHYHSEKCSKPAKLDEKANKALKKAAKAKGKGATCTINENEIEIEGKKKGTIELKDIEKNWMDKEQKVIAVASKTEKKGGSLIHALKFEDDAGFMRFSDALNDESSEDNSPMKSPSPPPIAPNNTVSMTSTPVSRRLSRYSDGRHFERMPSSRSLTSSTSTSTIRKQNHLSEDVPSYQHYDAQPSPKHRQPHAPPPIGPNTVTYMTTDALTTHERSKSEKKVSAADPYLIKMAPRSKDNNLYYITRKDMDKSGKNNIYHFTVQIRSASRSSTSSSSSSSDSTSTSTTDSYMATEMYRILPIDSSNNALFTASKSNSLDSFSSSSGIEDGQGAKMKTVSPWRQQKPTSPSSSSSSSSSSESTVENSIYIRRSRFQEIECPHCHRRSLSRIETE
ncbi:hypothetical protein Aperf_G00000032075 [Anoplocephala perfoliata]